MLQLTEYNVHATKPVRNSKVGQITGETEEFFDYKSMHKRTNVTFSSLIQIKQISLHYGKSLPTFKHTQSYLVPVGVHPSARDTRPE